MPNGGHSAKRTPLDAVRPLPIFAECLPLSSARHSTKIAFAECRSLPSARHSAKASLPSAIFYRVRRSAKQVFVECPKFGTRQRFLHSANHVFPVVTPCLMHINPHVLKWIGVEISLSSTPIHFNTCGLRQDLMQFCPECKQTNPLCFIFGEQFSFNN